MNIAGDNANIGEVQATAAGRDLYHGLSADDLRRALADQQATFDRFYRELRREIDRVEDAVDLWQHAFQQRLKAEADALKEEHAQRDIARKRLRRIEIMVVLITIALLVIIIRLWPTLTALALLS